MTAIGESFRLTWLITKEIGGVLGRLVQGSGREEISSPIGIVRGSSSALERGYETFFWVLGLISLSLALLNQLPLHLPTERNGPTKAERAEAEIVRHEIPDPHPTGDPALGHALRLPHFRSPSAA